MGTGMGDNPGVRSSLLMPDSKPKPQQVELLKDLAANFFVLGWGHTIHAYQYP